MSLEARLYLLSIVFKDLISSGSVFNVFTASESSFKTGHIFGDTRYSKSGYDYTVRFIAPILLY